MLGLLFRFALAHLETFVRRLRHGPARPGWSFRFEAMIAAIKRDNLATSGWSWQRQRAHEARLPVPRDAVGHLERRDAHVGGVPGAWFVPRTLRVGAVVLYFHGESYLLVSIRTHADLIARLV